MKKTLISLLFLIIFVFPFSNTLCSPLGPMSQIELVSQIFPFLDEYACIEDVNNNYYYIDAQGNIVLMYDSSYTHYRPFSIEGKHYTARFSDKSRNLEGFHLMDLSGNIIKEFDHLNYSYVGAVSDGLVSTAAITQSLSGTSYATIYYDTTGKEIFHFENWKPSGAASNFSNNCAILISPDSNQLAMVNRSGKLIPVQYNENSLIELLEQYERKEHQDSELIQITINDFSYKTINPFVDAEAHTSVLIDIKYDLFNGKTTSCNRRCSVAAALTREGSLTFIAVTTSVTQCFNNSIIIGAKDTFNNDIYPIIYNLNTKQFMDVRNIPEFINGDRHDVRFIENGYYLVYMLSQNNTKFYSIIDPNGSIVKPPAQAVCFSDMSIPMPYESGTSTILRNSSTENTPVITNIIRTTLYTAQRKTTGHDQVIQYISPDGQILNNAIYYAASPFTSNGYAIVCTESKQRPHTFTSYGCAPHFINSQGKTVEHIPQQSNL